MYIFILNSSPAVLNRGFLPFAIPLFAGAILLCCVAWMIYHKGSSLAARYMAIANVLLAIFVSGYAMELGQTTIEGLLFWLKIEYIGLPAAPIFIFMVTIAYLGWERRLLTPASRLFLLLIPLITILFAWTNERHELIWKDLRLIPAGSLYVADFTPGGWYWVNVAFCYFGLGAGVLFLIWSNFSKPVLYRKQILVLLAGLLLPFVGHVVYLIAFQFGTPLTTVNWWAYALILSGFILSWGLSQYRLFEITPLAHDLVFESMKDGVLVLDDHGRIVDINPAAQKMWSWDRSQVAGLGISELASPQELAVLRKAAESPNPTNLQIEINRSSRTLDVSISSISKTNGKGGGKLIVFRDISAHKQAEISLSSALENLQSQYQEVQKLQTELERQAQLDHLTGLYNRRYLSEIVPGQLAHSGAEKLRYSLAIIDIDHFKILNDEYGHQNGDRILQAMGNYLRARIRKGDIACRYGGDEFVVVLPGTAASQATQRLQQLLDDFEAAPIDLDNRSSSVTFSAGLAEYPTHGVDFEQVLQCADKALYAAKLAGRNRVIQSA